MEPEPSAGDEIPHRDDRGIRGGQRNAPDRRARSINQVKPVDSSLNPYAKGQPMDWATDCATFRGGAFPIGGNFYISQGAPAYVNMQLACYGTTAYGTPFSPNSKRPLQNRRRHHVGGQHC